MDDMATEYSRCLAATICMNRLEARNNRKHTTPNPCHDGFVAERVCSEQLYYGHRLRNTVWIDSGHQVESFSGFSSWPTGNLVIYMTDSEGAKTHQNVPYTG